MKTIIATLFILDFSGSMYQKIVDQSKYEVLQQKISSMSSTYQTQTPVAIYSFGQEGNKSCQSLKLDQMDFRRIPSWLRKQRPGKYAKTPLAYSIQKVAELTDKYQFEQVVIITDGADSCGQDPCKAVQDLAKVLEKKKIPLYLDLVGYDIKLHKDKLNCEVKSPALKYTTHFAASDVELSENLVNIDKKIKVQKATNLIVSGKTPQQNFGSESAEEIKNSKSNIDNKQSQTESEKSVESMPNLFSNETKLSDDFLSSLRVLNAPDGRTFFAYQNSELKAKWNGDFATILPPGDYDIRTVDNKQITQTIKVTIEKKQNKVVSYHLFLKDPTPHLFVQNTLFPLEIKAKEGDPKIVTPLPKQIIGSQVLALSEGVWEVGISFPWWLQTELKKEIKINPGEVRKIDFKKVHAESLKWIKNPNPKKDLALLVTTPTGEEKRLFVPPNMKSVPLLKEWSHHWIGQ